jgi:hypothetical protein
VEPVQQKSVGRIVVSGTSSAEICWPHTKLQDILSQLNEVIRPRKPKETWSSGRILKMSTGKER